LLHNAAQDSHLLLASATDGSPQLEEHQGKHFAPRQDTVASFQKSVMIRRCMLYVAEKSIVSHSSFSSGRRGNFSLLAPQTNALIQILLVIFNALLSYPPRPDVDLPGGQNLLSLLPCLA
jgi:hypothetical protein